MKKITAEEKRKLISFFIEKRGMSRGEAREFVSGLIPEGQKKALAAFMADEREVRQSVMPAPVAALRPPEPRLRAKKVPYTLLMPPEQLEALKVLVERDGSSVSHHIRQAVRSYLKGVRL